MQINWGNDWNRRMLKVLRRTAITEVGLIACRDVNAALSYEQKLLDCENQMKKEKATC